MLAYWVNTKYKSLFSYVDKILGMRKHFSCALMIYLWCNKWYFYEDALDVKLETLFSNSDGNQVIAHPYITRI